MDKIGLENYDELEMARMQAILQNQKGKKAVHFRDFFPELQLESPFTSPNLSPFWICLPFYKTQILYVYPFETPEVLQRVHNVSVGQLMSLKEQGKIEFILAGPPEQYAGLSYLDPVLELKPPSYTYRATLYFTLLHSSEWTRECLQEAETLFLGKLEATHKRLGIATPLSAFERSVIGAYLNMKGLGFVRLADAIKQIVSSDANVAAAYLEIYHDLLCSPIMACLGGCHSTTSSYLQVAADVARASGAVLPVGEMDEGGAFPIEVGRILCDRYQLVRPTTLGQALEVYPAYEEARLALKALSDYVRHKSIGKLIPAAEAVKGAFEEVRKVYGKKRKYEFGFQVTGVVGAAASALSGGLIGFLSALGFGLLTTPIATPVAEMLAKLGHPSNVISIYDFDARVTAKWVSTKTCS